MKKDWALYPLNIFLLGTSIAIAIGYIWFGTNSIFLFEVTATCEGTLIFMFTFSSAVWIIRKGRVGHLI